MSYPSSDIRGDQSDGELLLALSMLSLHSDPPVFVLRGRASGGVEVQFPQLYLARHKLGSEPPAAVIYLCQTQGLTQHLSFRNQSHTLYIPNASFNLIMVKLNLKNT